MKSKTLPSFWKEYARLDRSLQRQAKKAFQLWSDDPSHPSLRFKCINQNENIWSVRITRNYRAVGLLGDNSVTWIWIGGHAKYERFFG